MEVHAATATQGVVDAPAPHRVVPRGPKGSNNSDVGRELIGQFLVTNPKFQGIALTWHLDGDVAKLAGNSGRGSDGHGKNGEVGDLVVEWTLSELGLV